MSIAGIRSNRGDGYQTLVAFDWALTVLSDENYQWLEIDSILYPVDDVVVGKSDGTVIACQCKKNHTDFEAWSINDLASELQKAVRLLSQHRNIEVRFYSRNNFGPIGKLKEYCSTQRDALSYKTDLGAMNRSTDNNLSNLISAVAPGFSNYEFLSRTEFETSNTLDRMASQLRERLRNIASNPDAAFNALWVHLDQLGARMSVGDSSAGAQHRLIKHDLEAILNKAGALLAPPLNLDDIRASFSNTSAIGRSWRRDVAGKRIVTPVINELLAAINAKKRAILLTGLPGSGKTCAMLELQEALEQRAQLHSDIVPLFIQSREFADLATSHDRQTLGLSEQWVNQAARMAERAWVVVVLDSLDVLSIARDHRILTYFLAQIDRLLLVPQVTVVAACRDFDKQYDRRIAEREWDSEIKCLPLDWNTDVAPLLDKLAISSADIDAATRELIRNPRELALFVELALRGGGFSVVTSQALAQRYLDVIVRADTSLGDTAIQAIEAVAQRMLESRRLTVPHQQFQSPQEILRSLFSLNILQDTQDGKLTFGHQTLLDVLVISRALRKGVTLNKFIQSLPPVPFVRPCIRSFVAQLAVGERREFRKQLRAVLTGNSAFHIRRLVAESLSEQPPEDDDWPLMRELREKHRDVFQAIYYSAKTIEWHYFWLKHLVPVLKAAQDAEGYASHAYRMTQWKNDDTQGVLLYWQEALSLEWIDASRIAEQLPYFISEINSDKLAFVVPLLQQLLDMPQPDHSVLGQSIARCVEAGAVGDNVLWRYAMNGVDEKSIAEYNLHNRLRFRAHEFGDRKDNFFGQRMLKSIALLDLAIESIERWSNACTLCYGETRIGYRHGFLNETSYRIEHSQQDVHHAGSMNVLLSAVEASILHHAMEHSEWWTNNRERLCFNHEGALLYFAVQACTASPEANIDLIGRMLSDRNMLEFGLQYELGSLIRSAFTSLNSTTQDAAMATILSIWDEPTTEDSEKSWILKKRTELLKPIPSHLRSAEAQATIDAFERTNGAFVRQPDIFMRGGTVHAPFSFEIFLSARDNQILRLIAHYRGHSDWHGTGADFLIGGEREVGWQLREASSRHPTRFLQLLPTYWAYISEQFRDDIMDGIATYLAYRHGQLRRDDNWLPLEEPDASTLAGHILDELERHPLYWQMRRTAANALKVCANIVRSPDDAKRLVFLARGFDLLDKNDPIKGDNIDLINLGIDMAKGNIAEALLTLANNLSENNLDLPSLLEPALARCATEEHPAIRAVMLLHLPSLQDKNFELSWKLFYLIMQDARGLWQLAERCLYYAYHNRFETVRPVLARLRIEGRDKDLETWGRISALAGMARHIDFFELLIELKALESTDAWRGAASVWTNSENIQHHRNECFAGIEAGLNAGESCALNVAEQIDNIFRDEATPIPLPIEIIRGCFSAFENDNNTDNRHHRLLGLHEWLNAVSQNDPDLSLAVTKLYVNYASRCGPHIYDHKNSLTQLMTRLFAEAEEREESDEGAMLRSVVEIQDALLSLGVNGVADWLKAAERP
ncbi:MAG TPA: AAA family ATPase [Accumulibacter sp.]|uniref:AAA family ATPase n=1 Tax=Accumulibacter sp. TaxID=2053492 RepID=UPI002C9219BE|nr:AAA family ATPase [Accumulibacter sp.]HMW56884.1 AAA family ATPase [Accumulibacter sp.]HMW87725.1 AAA family ATPase [Nitrospira sp.]HNC91213.1 AAA family ATPase [Anaerolineales bacterium]